jgi:hypothetical protein
MLRQRIAEAGALHITFVIYQALALVANVLATILLAFATVMASLAAAQLPDAEVLALDSLVNTLAAAVNSAALLYGLWQLYVKLPTTRQFWTFYLMGSILLYGYLALIGSSGCASTVPMVINLGWLIYWTSSKRVAALYP